MTRGSNERRDAITSAGVRTRTRSRPRPGPELRSALALCSSCQRVLIPPHIEIRGERTVRDSEVNLTAGVHHDSGAANVVEVFEDFGVLPAASADHGAEPRRTPE